MRCDCESPVSTSGTTRRTLLAFRVFVLELEVGGGFVVVVADMVVVRVRMWAWAWNGDRGEVGGRAQ